MNNRIFLITIIGAGIFNLSGAQDRSLRITPVYQWTNSLEIPRFFVENPTANPLYKPIMFLKVGPGAGDRYWYYSVDSLGALLNPGGNAAAAFNKCGRTTKAIAAILFLGGLVWAVNNSDDFNDPVAVYGGGSCIAAGLICLYIPRVSKNDRLRIIAMHNKSIGY